MTCDLGKIKERLKNRPHPMETPILATDFLEQLTKVPKKCLEALAELEKP